MKMKSLIVTHPGKAHFDEFLAISLILADYGKKQGKNHGKDQGETGFIIERRDPDAKELDDPDVWVVDVGGRYEPEKKNFDHHQDINLGGSFILVADYLGLSDKLKNMSWWSFKDRMDRFGPVNMAKEFGVESLIETYSPFEAWFLTLFGKNPSSVCHLMHQFGVFIIEQADFLAQKLSFWDKCERIKIKGKTAIIGLTEDSSGLDDYCRSLSKDFVDIAISYDRRGKGWRLYRIETLHDNQAVDFTRIEAYDEILFAHKNGFIAKTKEKIEFDRVKELVSIAVKD